MIFGKREIGTIGIMGGVPFMHTEFAKFLVDLTQYNDRYLCQPEEEIHHHWATMSYHVAARNSLVNEATGGWLLMLDCDQVADPDVLVRMLNSMELIGCDVLTATYYYKRPPHLPVIYTWSEERNGLSPIAKMPDMPFRIDGCGGGCLLVRRSVFDRIRDEIGEGPFDIRVPYSEDLSFSVRCRELGIEMWCDPRIESRHLTLGQVGSEDHMNSVVGLEEGGLIGPLIPTEMIRAED